MKNILQRTLSALVCLAMILSGLPAISEEAIPAPTLEIVEDLSSTPQPTAAPEAEDAAEPLPEETQAPAAPEETATAAPESTPEASDAPQESPEEEETAAAAPITMEQALSQLTGEEAAASSVFTIEEGVLISYAGADAEVTVPEGVTAIGASAFEGNASIVAVTLPEGLNSIGERAFFGCTALENVQLPAAEIAIGASAFEGCAALAFLDVYHGVTIEENAFLGCTVLSMKVYPGSPAAAYCAQNDIPCTYYDPIAATAIIPAQASITLGLYEQASLADWTLEPAGAYETVSYTSRKSSTVSVTADGVVTALRANTGTYIYLTTSSGASCAVAVYTRKAPTAILISAERAQMGVGETQQITTVLSAGSAGAVQYKSSDESVATVDASGLITAHRAGVAEITATTYNGKVAPIPVSIEVCAAPTELTFPEGDISIGQGDSRTLSYAFNEGAAGQVYFASSDTTIATVDNSGKVKALQAGEVTITASTYVEGVTAECKVLVIPAPTAVYLNADHWTIGIGEKLQLEASLVPEDAATTLTYISGQPAIASVDENGVITGNKIGYAYIAAVTHNNKNRLVRVAVWAAPKSVTLTADRSVIGAGETLQLSYSFNKYAAGSVTFSSSDEAVASVDAQGLLTSGVPGTATITITTHNGISNSLEITVAEAPTSLTFPEGDISIGQGDSRALSYAFNEGAAGQVYFASSDTAIATVDASGKVKALQAGEVTITASTYVEGVTAECKVRVIPAPTAVYLNADHWTIGIGEKLQLEASLVPEDAATTLTYISGQPAIASVDKNGVITGNKIGYAYIAAVTHNNKNRLVRVAVWAAPKSVTLSAERSVIGAGETLQLSYAFNKYAAGSVTFASSDEAVASVDAQGLVTSGVPGTATITVTTHNGISNSLEITVAEAPTSLTFPEGDISIGQGDSRTLSYAFNEGAAGQVYFASSDTTIATVDNSGKVKALQAGEVTITASTYVEGVTAECKVRVIPAPTAVYLSADHWTIGIGEKLQLEASLVPEDAATTLTYISGQPAIASVDENGVITGNKIGYAYIAAVTHNNKNRLVRVAVWAAPKSVTLTADRSVIGAGETLQLSYAFNKYAAGSVTFSSSDESVASVNAQGLVTSGVPGSATITITTHNGISNSLEITVAEAPTELTFPEGDISIGQGDSRTLSYTFNEGAAGQVYFTSSDTTIATVDASGKVKALQAGEVTITASTYVEGVTAECKVRVIPAPTAVYLSADHWTIGIGEKLQLEASLVPEDAATTLTYISGQPAIASVDENGVITGNKIGYAYIAAVTHNNKNRLVKVTVLAAPKSVTVVSPRTQLGVGDSLQLTHKFSSGTAGTVSYTSLTPEIASVSEDGKVTALATGTARFTATSHNGVVSPVCTVEIVPAPENITMSSDSLLLGVGDSATLSAQINDGSAGEIRYASENPEVAVIDETTGKVTAVATGKTRLIATTYVEGLAGYAEIEVKAAPASLTLPYASLTLGVGDSYTLNPEIGDAQTTFTYWSSNSYYASVDASGKITALRTGYVVINILTHNGLGLRLPLWIQKAPTAILASPQALTLGLGESASISYSFPSGGVASVSFESLDPDVLSVDENGLVRALSTGSGSVQLTTHNGVSAICSVSVVPAPQEISLLGVDELGVGLSAATAVSMLPEDASSAIRYSIASQTPAQAGDEALSVVQIDDDGVITALNPGQAVLRAETYVEGVAAEHTIQILPAPTSVYFDAEAYTVDINSTLQLNPQVNAGAYARFTYAAAKDGFFTISEDGLLTPVMRGTTTVTATSYNGLRATVKITVVDPYYPEEMYLEDEGPGYMEPGDTYTPTVVVYPATAQLGLSWTSSNTSSVSVDAESGTITALASGQATITGKSTRNPSLQVSYSVVVLNESRCLTMPYTRTDTSKISTTLSQIRSVRASAYDELEQLYAEGVIGEFDYTWRRAHISNAFDMYLFPWMTDTYEYYWSSANSEGGNKDFKPGIVYYGLPYTQSNRKYNVKKAVNAGYFTSSGSGYYELQGSLFAARAYPGNDCSSFVAMSLYGTNSDNGYMDTRMIASSSAFRTLYDWTDLRPGDLLNKGGSHAVMFLYYANDAKTQLVILEQGGSTSASRGIDNLAYSNTIASSIKNVSYYTSRGYSIRRLTSFNY